nr:kinesin-like protein KIN-UB [Tanacetum cinerariifolium]
MKSISKNKERDTGKISARIKRKVKVKQGRTTMNMKAMMMNCVHYLKDVIATKGNEFEEYFMKMELLMGSNKKVTMYVTLKIHPQSKDVISAAETRSDKNQAFRLPLLQRLLEEREEFESHVEEKGEEDAKVISKGDEVLCTDCIGDHRDSRVQIAEAGVNVHVVKLQNLLDEETPHKEKLEEEVLLLQSRLSQLAFGSSQPRYSQLDDRGNGDRTSITNLHKHGKQKVLALPLKGYFR